MLIHPPRLRLLLRLWLLLVYLSFLVIASNGIFMFVTVPFSVVFVHHYYLLSKRWGLHRYSKKLLHSITFAVWLVTLVFVEQARDGIMQLLWLYF
ncbi:MAG: hypothetical protein K0Q94_6220 [Paenibacillus sp.]|uniref:hypothetical protein n=1 Tax=Paenibacillus sp. GCM10012303 TaxID=3317340 RepID=UPI0029EF6502|nr:hypothetical protein [Paenibacillus sp.]